MPLILFSDYRMPIMPYQQEIKRKRSEHLISPDMVTKKSYSAKRVRRAAAGFLSALCHERRKSNAPKRHLIFKPRVLSGTSLNLPAKIKAVVDSV